MPADGHAGGLHAAAEATYRLNASEAIGRTRVVIIIVSRDPEVGFRRRCRCRQERHDLLPTGKLRFLHGGIEMQSRARFADQAREGESQGKEGIADGTAVFAATNKIRRERTGFRIRQSHRVRVASGDRARTGWHDDLDGTLSPMLGSQRRYRRGRQRGLASRPMPNVRCSGRAPRERHLSRESDEPAARGLTRASRGHPLVAPTRFISRKTRLAALCPAAPMTEPAGWQPALHE